MIKRDTHCILIIMMNIVRITVVTIFYVPLDMFIKYDPIYHGFNYLFENFDKLDLN